MSDHDLYAIAEAHLRTIRDLERDLAAERDRVKRLRKALRNADSRVIQFLAEEYTRNTGALPPHDWFRRAINTQESTHYANDGLEFGDLDDREARS